MADFTIYPCGRSRYVAALQAARDQSGPIRRATSPIEEMPTDADYFLSLDGKSGYGVTMNGELVGLFSLVPGRGKDMVQEAIDMDGARRLDCFDGFLPEYYKQFGFVEYMREANWTPGGPDVVYMELHSEGSPLAGDAS